MLIDEALQHDDKMPNEKVKSRTMIKVRKMLRSYQAMNMIKTVSPVMEITKLTFFRLKTNTSETEDNKNSSTDGFSDKQFFHESCERNQSKRKTNKEIIT